MRRGIVDRVWGAGGIRLLLGDAAVVALLAAVVAGLFVARADARPGGRVEVAAAGLPARPLDLSRDRVEEVAGPLGATRIEVRGARARVLSSPCRLGLCRHGGWVDASGGLIVCIPNGVVLRAAPGTTGAPDAVSR